MKLNGLQNFYCAHTKAQIYYTHLKCVCVCVCVCACVCVCVFDRERGLKDSLRNESKNSEKKNKNNLYIKQQLEMLIEQ